MKTPTKPKKAKQGKATTPPKRRGLLPRQERFCELVVSGLSHTDAWLAAGYKVDRITAAQNAAESLRNPKISAKIAELRKPKTEKAFLTRDRKREILLEIVTDPKTKATDRMRAIEIDAKLAGDFAPEQHVVETGPNTLESIRERAAAVASALDLNARLRARANRSGTTTRSGLSRWNPEITA